MKRLQKHINLPKLKSYAVVIVMVISVIGFGLNYKVYAQGFDPNKLSYDDWYNRGVAELNKQNYESAAQLFTYALEKKGTVDAYINRGISYTVLQQYDKAIADFTKAIELDPKSAIAYDDRGSIYRKLQQYDKAIADFNKEIELDPKNTTMNTTFAYTKRDLCYKALNQPDKTKALAPEHYATKALPETKTKANYSYLDWYNKGNDDYDKKDYETAIVSFTNALGKKPTAYAYSLRGDSYKNLKQYDKALNDYNKAIELDPKCYLAYDSRGTYYNGLKQYYKAITDYTKAIEFNPNNADFYNNRGLVYKVLNQLDKAEADFAKAKALNDKRLADYNEAIELYPNAAYVYFNRGGFYSDFKKYNKAIADYTKAIELDPKLADAYYYRGLAYKANEQHDKAKADFAKAKALDPKRYGDIK